jgi:uncharacterized membrane protein
MLRAHAGISHRKHAGPQTHERGGGMVIACSHVMTTPPPALEPVADNIRSIVDVERRSQRARSWQQRISDRVTAMAGTLAFVLFHVALFSAWAGWNALAPAHLHFDPYPYGLLNFVVSLEGVLVATFVLITQKRMSRLSDARDHLNLQIDLLAEQELTLLLRMMRRVSDRLGIAPDDADTEHAEKLAAETNVSELMDEIERELPTAAPGRSKEPAGRSRQNRRDLP